MTSEEPQGLLVSAGRVVEPQNQTPRLWPKEYGVRIRRQEMSKMSVFMFY